MSKVLTGYTINYVDDFGQEFKNLPLKFGASIPADILEAGGYTNNVAGKCGVGRLFKPRALVVSLTDGSTHRLVVNLDNVITIAQTLLAKLTVACVALDGESWGTVPDTKINSPTYKTDPWAGIPDKRVTEGVTFEYSSDIIGAIKMSTRIETQPADLNSCQKAGLDNPTVLNNTCGNKIPIKPRRFRIFAPVVGGGTIGRQAIVSDFTQLASKGNDIASCSICLGYKGETISNLAAAGLTS